ncbi:MAG: tRNA (adenosine(37)-N6)-threonylcarbamoyltransferase complex ATPase subunit type 1 TsaE [Oscillospiraceae bacterium]|nr:tRNA (adenosine(37)-N6)-threonylcarbamoyltransferase complex ATPase subunit type 1 TsaE [Oscillospiraceae bacterium]
MKKTTYSAEETIEFAVQIGKMLKKGDIIAYTGGLGAGKTTFTRGLASGMGLEDNGVSPTFSLVNEYRGDKLCLYHFDMYRIMSADDLETTGFYDYPMEESVFAIEWSENIADELPENTIFIDIERVDESIRSINVKGDERFADAGN